MIALVVPNISEGRDVARIQAAAAAIEAAGAKIADVHSDAVHNRSVLTAAGDPAVVPEAMARLAGAMRYINLARHTGVHPRLGGLDVCPVVAWDQTMSDAVAVAHHIGDAIAEAAAMPVFFYGAASMRPETARLSDLRRGGLGALIRRAESGLVPDRGPQKIDARRGVVCVGARPVLIAFNVWLGCDEAAASRLAARTRTSGGGPPGVQALGWRMGANDLSQVSMNLVDPDTTGIEEAFRFVRALARAEGIRIVATEIVGVPPKRYLPPQDSPVTRLLRRPARSLEVALESVLRA